MYHEVCYSPSCFRPDIIDLHSVFYTLGHCFKSILFLYFINFYLTWLSYGGLFSYLSSITGNYSNFTTNNGSFSTYALFLLLSFIRQFYNKDKLFPIVVITRFRQFSNDCSRFRYSQPMYQLSLPLMGTQCRFRCRHHTSSKSQLREVRRVN